MVPPFDDPRTIAGAGTVGLEILARVPALRAVFVPIGGGGLVSGIAVVVKALRPEAAVIGVEPEGAACMTASLAAGQPITLPGTASIADGLLPVRPGALTFLHVSRLVDAVRDAGANGTALLVSGESGVGKSALTLAAVAELEAADPGQFEAVVLNFRSLPSSTLELRNALGMSLKAALAETAAPSAAGSGPDDPHRGGPG